MPQTLFLLDSKANKRQRRGPVMALVSGQKIPLLPGLLQASERVSRSTYKIKQNKDLFLANSLAETASERVK
jgi:hypothetical protein